MVPAAFFGILRTSRANRHAKAGNLSSSLSQLGI
jgi:hypothetical protein